MQGPPRAPSENYRRWKRRQQRLLILLGVLVLLEIALLARGIMLLPASSATALAPTPTATSTPTPTPSPVPTPPPPTIQAAASMLEDVSTHRVLTGQNVDAELPMASTTKIMTAVVALETGHLDQSVTIGSDVLDLPSDASRMGLSVGEVLTMRQLLYGLMLPSGDDAAIAIADAVGKERGANFIDLMNQQAQFLGLTHTHYVNSNGLDAPGHYTTASDLVNLTRFALRLPPFVSLIATYEYKIPATGQHKAYDLLNTNQLLWPNSGYPGADGVKTGTTGKAGACLVFSATRNDHQLVGVVLDAPSDDARYTEARQMLNWGFSVIGSA
ncbi:MAG TPA: D-alanyl-D-alanine carboxypeptidase family protein [Ktedonobacterales bacterium]|nr:D-alanyl-D-alanine carboxypeptidase family protein [Ktedonobacterales bacterium]